ncbi:hypothetical protein XBKB1_3390002 [Xenorhabdus bovienii str. kraussei Becker Underwood]|uniref:Uncharacterized protein n=1 Tax=Xenorhabdus bovienii str. kraussei Becker Underwood TaxID=1398204 RepID=A0A077PW73_XENBV|nr:hypothetical protein XBKB1_3390002 [Xenorhabdus bovienii str. kraussei Becker Underwood]
MVAHSFVLTGKSQKTHIITPMVSQST